MPRLPDRLDAGSPLPLGATWDGLGINFAVFSANATHMELCLFDPQGKREIARFDLPECTDEVWHGYLPDALPGTVYGYRAHGPYEPQNGHRFNPNKLLLDPYARRLTGNLRWTDALFGYRARSPRADLSFDRRDSAPAMVKGVVTDESFSWNEDRRPNVPWSETIIYEAHLKGLTARFDSVRPPERGTFAALTHPDVIGHLRNLGVTAIELLPIHAFLHDRHLVARNVVNYWGYNTLSFFTPEPAYLSSGEANEMRAAIRRLHMAGIEVILDVVYNHTCEGSELGPTLCWRGLDNASYYHLLEDDRRYPVNDTGTGNTLNLSHPRVLQMVLDSLRYWAEYFHVDGFRFDLGSALGREFYGFDPAGGFFDAVLQDPLLSRLKLISEPWDIGPGGYQLGNHPPRFAEWNDRYRDTARRFWRGDSGMRPELARRLSGSADIFHRARRPWASVNYLASHDGMTLNDLVSYGHKHNEANGEYNSDGSGDDHSANWGIEGPTEDEKIVGIRERLKRSLLATLFFSLGTPMLMAGDEFGRTQGGNNNAYCQDNEISWIDWSLKEQKQGSALFAFVCRLGRLRRNYPLLRSARHLHGQEAIATGVLDIEWFDERGQPLSEEDWGNPEGRALVMRRAGRDASGRVVLLSLALNASAAALDFVLTGAAHWRVLADSAAPDRKLDVLEGNTVCVADRAALLLEGLTENS
jgi:glycogen operon protein